MSKQYIQGKFTYINKHILHAIYFFIFLSIIFQIVSKADEWFIVALILSVCSRLIYKYPGQYKADDSRIYFHLFFSKIIINYNDIKKIDTEIINVGYDRLALSTIHRCKLKITTKQKNFILEMDYKKNLSNMVDTPHELQKTIDSHPFKVLEKYVNDKIHINKII